MKQATNQTAFFLRVIRLPLLVIFGSVILLSGCAQKKIDPLTFPILEADKLEAQYPPSKDELVLRPNILLPLLVFKSQTVTEGRLKEISHFVNSSFKQYGNFSIISQNQTDTLLAKKENKHFQPSNVADAIQLGSSVNADFVSQMQATIIESKMVDNVDRFKANINLTVFRTDSGQVVVQENIRYDSQKYDRSYKDLKQLIQTYFQIRGYILETRGAHQVAKISLGRSVGIELGRKIQIRERIVKTQIINDVSHSIISFDVNALAETEVIKVMEDDSWVLVNKKDQVKIKKGQVVFTMPE